MSRMTNPDDAMMEEQQEADLGHAFDEDKPGAKIERLPEGVDADGLIRGAQEMDESADTEKARLAAASRAKTAGRRR